MRNCKFEVQNCKETSIFHLRVLLLGFSIFVLFCNVSFASSTSVDVTKIAVGARSLAMGRVSMADPGDINALFINPANAAALQNWGATSMYTSLLEGDINYTMIGGAKAKIVADGTLGLAYLAGSSGGLTVTTIDANSRVAPTGTTFGYANSTITIAYGKSFRPNLDLGGSLKLFSKSFGSQGGGSGYGVDLGLLYKLKDNFNLGLTIQNVLSSLNWASVSEGTPLGIKCGLNYGVSDNLLLAADADFVPIALHAGVEWKPMPLLAVRGGLERIPTGNSSAVINIAMGVGVNYNGWKFDYAYLNDGALVANSTHFFTFSFMPEVPKLVEKPVEKAAPVVQPVLPSPPPEKVLKPQPTPTAVPKPTVESKTKAKPKKKK